MESRNWLELISEEAQQRELLAANEYTKPYGLALSEEDIRVLLMERKHILQTERRVEFANSILPQIIYTFCDSAYISQEDYREALIRLQEIFFLYKNEMQDEITDEELLNFMKEQFETVCFGDLDYLAETCLEVFAQAIRAGYRGYIRTNGKGEFTEMDQVMRWDRSLYLEALKQLE